VREKDNPSNAANMGLQRAAFMLGVPDSISYDSNDTVSDISSSNFGKVPLSQGNTARWLDFQTRLTF
jgi:hypothetical protein